MPRKVFRIPSSVVNIVREVEKFLVFMGRGSQVPREKNLSMKKLINIVLNMRNMLKNEVGAEVSQYEGSSKYQYNEVCGTNIKKGEWLTVPKYFSGSHLRR